MTEVKDRKLHVRLSLPLITFLLLFHPLTSAFAQNTFAKAGVNLSSVSGIEEKTFLTAYHLAIGGVKKLSSKIGIKHELVFSQQGTRINDDARLVYYYLNAPILLNVQLGSTFSLNVGPQIGMALKALEKGQKKDLTATTNTFDISACLGFNYHISQRFFAETRLNIGLTDLSRAYEAEALTNVVFQGSMGYYFKRKNEHSE